MVQSVLPDPIEPVLDDSDQSNHMGGQNGT